MKSQRNSLRGEINEMDFLKGGKMMMMYLLIFQ